MNFAILFFFSLIRNPSLLNGYDTFIILKYVLLLQNYLCLSIDLIYFAHYNTYKYHFKLGIV